MNTTQSSLSMKFKVGLFTLVGVALIAATTVLVNDRPFWWRPCQLVRINVEDATGLKSKSPVRSLGIEIGYLESVSLSETHVTLGICITAPVEVLPTTRAYIRGEGFLGDKFVELRPVKYVGATAKNSVVPAQIQARSHSLMDWIFPSAWAEPPTSTDSTAPSGPRQSVRRGREIPVGSESQDVQQLVNRVNELVQQMATLTGNLEHAINPEDLRRTMQQLNQTLANASKTLAPEGGLTQTAQRSLGKLEDAIEQLRDLMTRVNKGEGSLGMLLNDPAYAEEIRKAIYNLNHLLGRANDINLLIDVGAAELPAFNGGRAWIHLSIWPQPERYYLIGLAFDPRGRISNTTTTTTIGGLTQTVQTRLIDQTGILITALLGKVYFKRLDLSAGALYGDGAASAAIGLGPKGEEFRIKLKDDLYFRTAGSPINNRLYLTAHPFGGSLRNVYASAGLESFQRQDGRINYLLGVGISFEDNDIKLLLSLR
jgi:phospholipid/cholesterol/gamma-HCH transport system substrate-binding protein